MTTLEELLAPSSLEASEPLPPMKSSDPSYSLSFRIWNQLVVGILFFALGVGAGGLFYFKNQMGRSWQQAVCQFHWLVLVQGEQLQIDEVGRFLRQMDGAANVGYVSPEESFERFKNDSNFAQDLESLGGNPFPPCWEVSWKESALDPSKLQETWQDVRTLPGVVDVAFDQRALEQVHLFRLHWYQVKLLLSLLMLVFVVFFSVLLGRFLFFSSMKKLKVRPFAWGLFVDVLFWSLGLLTVNQLLGPLPFALVGGGIILSFCRWAWSVSSNKTA